MNVRLNDKPSEHTWNSGGLRLRISLAGNVEWTRGIQRVSTPKLKRYEVDAEVVRKNVRSVVVRLPDGNVVKRKRGRDYGL